nr:nadh dehydrogenase (ubiquinone) complex i, assembly factor 6 [Quercus suber]
MSFNRSIQAWRMTRRVQTYRVLQRSASTHLTPPASPTSSPDEQIRARSYCLDLVRRYDTPSSLLIPYIPRHARDAYVSLRAFNIDIARTADTTSTPTIGAMRLQFQRDAVSKSLAGSPPKQPVAILLALAAEQLYHLSEGRVSWSRSWFMRLIDTREKYLSNAPYPSLSALETYAENTYSTLLYLTLQTLPMTSLTADHIASHIGKAAGIAAVLRGLPLLAFPGPPNKHSNQNSQHLAGDVGASQHGAVTLPLDIMAEACVREEDVLRNGSAAKGLRDAVFTVATRANDHLITARQMLANIAAGEDAGHAFEHAHEAEHVYPPVGLRAHAKETAAQEVQRAFGVFMPAVATQLWLDRLQAQDFDVFSSNLRVTDWRLPWKALWAGSNDGNELLWSPIENPDIKYSDLSSSGLLDELDHAPAEFRGFLICFNACRVAGCESLTLTVGIFLVTQRTTLRFARRLLAQAYAKCISMSNVRISAPVGMPIFSKNIISVSVYRRALSLRLPISISHKLISRTKANANCGERYWCVTDFLLRQPRGRTLVEDRQSCDVNCIPELTSRITLQEKENQKWR